MEKIVAEINKFLTVKNDGVETVQKDERKAAPERPESERQAHPESLVRYRQVALWCKRRIPTERRCNSAQR